MAISSIGEIFTFIRMTQPPIGFIPEGFIEVRPGVTGHSVWRDVQRGRTWQSETFTTMESSVAAWQLARIHEQYAPFAGPVQLVWDGVEFDYHVVVLNVVVLEVKEMVFQVGGIGTGSLRSQWTFLAVEKVDGNDGVIEFP